MVLVWCTCSPSSFFFASSSFSSARLASCSATQAFCSSVSSSITDLLGSSQSPSPTFRFFAPLFLSFPPHTVDPFLLAAADRSPTVLVDASASALGLEA